MVPNLRAILSWLRKTIANMQVRWYGLSKITVEYWHVKMKSKLAGQ